MLKRVMLVVTLAIASTAWGQESLIQIDDQPQPGLSIPIAQPVVAATSTTGLVIEETTISATGSTSTSPAEVVDVPIRSNLVVSTASDGSASGTDGLAVSETILVEKKEQQPPREESGVASSVVLNVSQATTPDENNSNFLGMALDGFEIVMVKFFGWNK